MKSGIHPNYYDQATVTCACGNTFTVGREEGGAGPAAGTHNPAAAAREASVGARKMGYNPLLPTTPLRFGCSSLSRWERGWPVPSFQEPGEHPTSNTQHRTPNIQ